MLHDWQMIAVTLIVCAATLYVARHLFRALKSFRTSKNDSATCATGCGNCGAEKTAATKSVRH